MSLPTPNVLKRRAMSRITRNMGKSHLAKIKKDVNATPIKHVLICRPNQRLGNMLLLTPLVQEVVELFPNCKMDLIVKGNVAIQVFKEYNNVKQVLILPRKPFKELKKYLSIFTSVKWKKYDLVINGDEGSSSGRILTYLTNAKYKIYGMSELGVEDHLESRHMAKRNVFFLREYMRQIGLTCRDESVPKLELKLTERELKLGKDIIDSNVENPLKPTITIFTYATGSKCYSKEWWSECCHELNIAFGKSYNILEILPVENVSQIEFKERSFYTRDIREMAAVIAHSSLFISADCGVMHLASASETPTVALFSGTREYMYEPYGNGSFSINTNLNSVKEVVEQILNSKILDTKRL